jgi:hypothetical protein
MDSSRTGLLSTLLMTLPLIVVPAVALLRQPGGVPGISTSSLDAAVTSADDDFGDLAGLFDEEPSDAEPDQSNPSASTRNAQDVDGLFQEVPESEPFDRRSKPADARERANGDDSAEVDPDLRSDDSHAPAGEAAKIELQLTAEGALRTLWFDAGERTPVGLAVFFRGETDLVRIRFEAVGQNRDACARNVLQQFKQWRQEQEREP